MKIQTYRVNEAMRSGIQFLAKTKSGRGTLFFWSPRVNDNFEIFAKWIPDDQRWQLLPLDRLPAKKRSQLQEFWDNRARIQATEAKRRMVKAKPTPEPA